MSWNLASERRPGRAGEGAVRGRYFRLWISAKACMRAPARRACASLWRSRCGPAFQGGCARAARLLARVLRRLANRLDGDAATTPVRCAAADLELISERRFDAAHVQQMINDTVGKSLDQSMRRLRAIAE